LRSCLLFKSKAITAFLRYNEQQEEFIIRLT
jgi:hypothetical protein